MWELNGDQELREWVSNPFCTLPGDLTGELTVCCTVISWSLQTELERDQERELELNVFQWVYRILC